MIIFDSFRNRCRYEIFLAVNVPNFVNYELSSKGCFIFKGLRGFLEAILMILLNSKVIKMLIFQCFVELITELGKGNQRVDRRDMPFPAIEHLF